MSNDRWTDQEDTVHIYNVILLSHIKEQNCVICKDVDGPRVCHTEWSKPEREKQISYINTYMWNLEKLYRWTYLQGRNRDVDIETGIMDIEGEGEGGTNWEIRIDIYTLPCVKQSYREHAIKHRKRRSVLCDNLDGCDGGGGWEGGPRGRGYMYTYSWFTSLYSIN